MNPTGVAIWSVIAVAMFLVFFIIGVMALRRIDDHVHSISRTLAEINEHLKAEK
jgi:hypothetical protein